MDSDDLKTSLLAMAWTFRLLPILVLAVFGFLFRRRLRQPVAFTVLGALVFFGVAWLVSQFAWSWRLDFMTSSPKDEFAVAVLSSALVQFVVTLVVSIAPVVWLYRLLARERVPDQTPDTALERTREK